MAIGNQNSETEEYTIRLEFTDDTVIYSYSMADAQESLNSYLMTVNHDSDSIDDTEESTDSDSMDNTEESDSDFMDDSEESDSDSMDDTEEPLEGYFMDDSEWATPEQFADMRHDREQAKLEVETKIKEKEELTEMFCEQKKKYEDEVKAKEEKGGFDGQIIKLKRLVLALHDDIVKLKRDVLDLKERDDFLTQEVIDLQMEEEMCKREE